MSSLLEFSHNFRDLFEDKWLYQGFVGTLQGIFLGAGTLIISRIARYSPVTYVRRRNDTLPSSYKIGTS